MREGGIFFWGGGTTIKLRGLRVLENLLPKFSSDRFGCLRGREDGLDGLKYFAKYANKKYIVEPSPPSFSRLRMFVVVNH